MGDDVEWNASSARLEKEFKEDASPPNKKDRDNDDRNPGILPMQTSWLMWLTKEFQLRRTQALRRRAASPGPCLPEHPSIRTRESPPSLTFMETNDDGEVER